MCHPRYHNAGKGEGQWKYSKPNHSRPTEHVMVGGPVEWMDQVRQSTVDMDLKGMVYVSDLMPPRQAHFFVSFDSVEDAQAAAEKITSLNESLVAPAYFARLESDADIGDEKEGVSRPIRERQGDQLGDDDDDYQSGCPQVVEKNKAVENEKKKKERVPRVVCRYAEIENVAEKIKGEIVMAEVSATACGIPGLILVDDFVTEEEEQELLNLFDKCSWERLARRRVQHYGKRFSYLDRNVDLERHANAIPDRMQEVVDKVTKVSGVSEVLDQITVNEYPIGVGLSPHVDIHSGFGDVIASLSLASSAAMVFRRGDSHRALFLPRRSLLLMTKEARWAWEHCIPHRKTDVLYDGSVVRRNERRVSLTIRSIRHGPCTCPYPQQCDSQEGSIPPTRMGAFKDMSIHDDSAKHGQYDDGDDIEEGNVRVVYDAIARHFSATRVAIWPKVREFIESVPTGGIIADVGCGNGKYFGVRKDLFVMGSDRSQGLVKVASKRLSANSLGHVLCPKADVAIADGLSLPYKSESCDAALSIAVIHHMSSVSRRVGLIEEISRILRIGGRAIITAWATDQEDMKKLEKWEKIDAPSRTEQHAALSSPNDYLVPWHLPLHRVEAAELTAPGGPVQGGEIDHEKQSIKFKRYYHLFISGELEKLVQLCRHAVLVDSFYDKDNWCIVIERV